MIFLKRPIKNKPNPNSRTALGSGVTLTVDPGTVVNFASGARLTVYGTLNVNGTSSNLVTFTRSGASGTWDSIKYQSSGNGTISYATIEYSTTGIQINSSSSPEG